MATASCRFGLHEYRTRFVLLLISFHCAKKAVSKSALVCQGDRLSLTCSGSANSQRWNVIATDEAEDSHAIAVLPPSMVRPPTLRVNRVLLHFSITSTTPLTSTVVIDNVTSDANGIGLNCTHSAEMTTSYTITVVTNASVSIPSIMVIERYGADNVSVTIEWTKEQFVSYNIAITPDTVVEENSENSRLWAQLKVAYNIMYTVKLIGSLCGHNATKAFELLYARCDYPLELPVNVVISGHTNPALVGSNITISCLIEDVPTAPNTSLTITCMENGQWLPDPRQLVEKCDRPNFTVDIISTEDPSNTSVASTCRSDENYTCITKTTELKRSAVTYIVIGSSLVGFIIMLTGGIVLVIVVICKKGRPCGHKVYLVALESRDVNTNQLNDPNCYLGEYSLLQHISPRQDHHVAPVTPAGQAQTLVYADLGPLSLERQSHITEDALDDDRVEYAQINTKASAAAKLRKIQPVSAERTDCADDRLNLDSLLIQIKPDITQHWYKFGKVIGVDNRVLDKCSQCAAEESIIEVCDHWLRNHTGQPTWREVAEALRQINFIVLASEINQVYETGKLPKEENMSTSTEESAETPPPIPPRLI